MKVKNDDFLNIIKQLEQCRPGAAINALENLMLAYPKMGSMDSLLAIKNDYHLMLQYWEQGFEDVQREQLFGSLLSRLYMLTANLHLSKRIHESAFWLSVYQRPRQTGKDWSMGNVRHQLENFTSETALLELEQPHLREQKAKTLYETHLQLMQDLFGYILTSRQWTDGVTSAFENILLSPTVDVIDQQLIVSAIMLSAMQTFDANKFQLLLNVYRNAAAEAVRQRALVGWALALDENKQRLYPEVAQMVDEVLADEHCCQELTELQMQIVYCMNAAEDQRTIRNEIMPEILSGSNMQVKNGTLIEIDEESLEDILHPESAERNMEKMEQSMHRMADMQKQGADIYFGGFSQMKRFSFFADLSNWFVPFYPQHPSVSHIWNSNKAARFLRTITEAGAFCDSDKYSFVLGFDYVVGHLPANMLKMVEDGEASPMPVGGMFSREEQNQPAFIRRLYLQNLYRFFKLYGNRSEFCDPFTMPTAIFLGKETFSHGQMQQHLMEVSTFLYKRKWYHEAGNVMGNIKEEGRTFSYYILQGALQQQAYNEHLQSPLESFAEALKLQPDSERALTGFARTSFNAEHYETALEAYEKLLTIKPDSKAYQLYAAICYSNLERNEEAERLLFKLNYLYPDDHSVNSVLAWVLTLNGKYGQAEQLFQSLLSAENPKPMDFLNQGFCYWLAGKTAMAIASFRRFMAMSEDQAFRIDDTFLHHQYHLLQQHGISDVEISMMLDALQ